MKTPNMQRRGTSGIDRLRAEVEALRQENTALKSALYQATLKQSGGGAAIDEIVKQADLDRQHLQDEIDHLRDFVPAVVYQRPVPDEALPGILAQWQASLPAGQRVASWSFDTTCLVEYVVCVRQGEKLLIGREPAVFAGTPDEAIAEFSEAFSSVINRAPLPHETKRFGMVYVPDDLIRRAIRALAVYHHAGDDDQYDAALAACFENWIVPADGGKTDRDTLRRDFVRTMRESFDAMPKYGRGKPDKRRRKAGRRPAQ